MQFIACLLSVFPAHGLNPTKLEKQVKAYTNNLY